MTSSRSRKRSSPAFFALAALVIFAALSQLASAAPPFEDVGIPAKAEAGAPIPVYVNMSSEQGIQSVWLHYDNSTYSSAREMSLESGNSTRGTWHCEIPAQTWKGVVEWRLTARFGNGSLNYPESGYGQIEIEGKNPPKPFPWNIVVTVAFLGVVLVLTELAFKPGVYRKTGRERAMELEEEDRAREAAEGKEQGPEGRN